jgi:hypothetical protein
LTFTDLPVALFRFASSDFPPIASGWNFRRQYGLKFSLAGALMGVFGYLDFVHFLASPNNLLAIDAETNGHAI